jgi:hypothetical protein
MTDERTIIDRALTAAVQVLYCVLLLAVLGLLYQYATLPTHHQPGAVRGSVLGPATR